MAYAGTNNIANILVGNIQILKIIHNGTIIWEKQS